MIAFVLFLFLLFLVAMGILGFIASLSPVQMLILIGVVLLFSIYIRARDPR